MSTLDLEVSHKNRYDEVLAKTFLVIGGVDLGM